MKLFQILKKNSALSEIQSRITAMSDRSMMFRGKSYSMATIRVWCNFKSVWEKFCVASDKCYTLSEVSFKVAESFMKFCDDVGYSLTTKKLYYSLLVALIRSSSLSIFNLPKMQQFSPENHIYLTEREISRLEELDLSSQSYLSKVRDIFLIGYYTGQRFSDYKRLSSNDIIDIVYGGEKFKALKIRQCKTNSQVIVPVLDERVVSTMSNYGGRVPQISHSGFNAGLKKLCRMAGITQPIVVTKSKGGAVSTTTIPKWEAVSSHTARRSCITNLYLGGKLTEMQIRSISGHTTNKSFKKYICCSAEENAVCIIKLLKAPH